MMLSVHIASTPSGPSRVELRNEPLPRIAQGFARIRLLLGGICSTDLELQRGYYGFSGTPGHEFVGEVIAVNDSASKYQDGAGRDVVSNKWLGKRVVGEINLACGHCAWCRRGLGRHCPTRTVLGILNHPGAFREFLTLPIHNLHAVPPSVTAEQAVFVEPLAAACEILDQVKIPRGERVAILGDGKLGLLIAQVLLAHGAQVELFGRHRAKLKIAERDGAEIQRVPKGSERTAFFRVVRDQKWSPSKAYRWVVDATGSSAGLRAAVSMCEPRGTVILKSTVHGLVELDTAPVIVDEITLIGSRCGRFEPALRLLKSGRVNVNDLISDEFPLHQAPAAFAAAATKGALKILLRSG
jgi:threonine dehydrogenase-like Zn-dependent dehydrogenase